MKQEQKALIVSAIINIIVSALKVVGGILFNCYTLIADGFYTISDFITDVLAMIGAKVGKRRANKRHPFGYGRFEYIMQIFIGIIIFLVGIFILIKSFFIEYSVVNLNILFIVLLVIFLKILSSNFLMQKGKDISSLILISSAKESFIDVISSIMVFFVILIGQAFPSIDIVGSVIIAILILIEALKIIIDNVILLIGEDDNNKEIKKELKDIINSINGVNYSDSSLIKNGTYYQATIEIAVDESILLKDLIVVENKIRKCIKKSKLNIRYLHFDIIKN